MVRFAMRIIAKKKLKLFWAKHVDAEQPLKSWFRCVEASVWLTPHDIKDEFNSADVLRHNRVVFNIKGNKYRLIAAVNYNYKIVYIRFIGTHADYDKIDAINI